MIGETNSWEKQDYETAKQYEYFCEYRDMGKDRSLNKLQQKLKKTISFRKACEQYSKKNHWQQRCEDYQLYLERKLREQNEQEILAMNRRHIGQAVMIQAKVIEKLKSANAGDIRLADCARLLDIASRIERTARGCDSVNMRVEQSGTIHVESNDKVRRLSDEDLQTISDLLEKNGEDE